jgi:glycosyltransferase involved in cell wall biosynthesis
MANRRLSICYAAPGHSLVSTSGGTRNVLSLAQALSEWADVTVAFRRLLEPVCGARFKVIAIEPDVHEGPTVVDDDATKGINPLTHLSYLRTLRSFSSSLANSFDVVFEKGWRLSGYLLAAFRRRGVPGALIEGDVRLWHEPLQSIRGFVKYALHSTAQCVAGSCSRQAPIVIAETEELKSLLVRHRGVAPERVAVVDLGVDHGLFRPMDQDSARNSLGIRQSATVLLYVGGMDKYHDLCPVIEALPENDSALELHLVGDGEYRRWYEAKGQCKRVRFHGRVPHHRVPWYIAASDLCIAPYRVDAFYDGIVTFSTLKIPEYMACGRPVVSVPSGSIQRLIQDQVSGFVFPNDVAAWRSFFKALPSRAQLKHMGRPAAGAVASRSWERTAASYLEVCRKLKGEKGSLNQ